MARLAMFIETVKFNYGVTLKFSAQLWVTTFEWNTNPTW